MMKFIDGGNVMSLLKVFLFGKFQVKLADVAIAGFEARKVQELFCYLLLNRTCPQPREVLADALWGDMPASKPRNYLRKALWQLQSALNTNQLLGCPPLIQVEADWIQLNDESNLRLDIALFEQAYLQTKGLSGQQLDSRLAQLLCWAAQLYQGPLLNGWYMDWCIYARERFQFMYLSILDKLMDYFEGQQDFESGIQFGFSALSYEPAREDTHRRIMRMLYCSGHRTEALRQYQRCVEALETELAVKPTAWTVDLYNQIRADQLTLHSTHHHHHKPETSDVTLTQVLQNLCYLEASLADLHGKVQQHIVQLEQRLGN